MTQRQIIKRLNHMLERSDYDEFNDDLNIGLLIEDINEDLLQKKLAESSNRSNGLS